MASTAEKTEAIVLTLVRHNDRSNVVTLYTRAYGRVACIVPTGSGRSARLRSARLMPLSLIEVEMRMRHDRDLQTLRGFGPASVWHDIYFNPAKTAVAMFYAEFLSKLLRDTSPDEAMWRCVTRLTATLNAAERPAGTANFHILALASLAVPAGIFPDIASYAPGYCFDMRGGSFMATPPPHRDFIPPQEAAVIPILAKLRAATAERLRLPSAVRQAMLDRMLAYFAIHFPGTSSLKSLPILREVFR